MVIPRKLGRWTAPIRAGSSRVPGCSGAHRQRITYVPAVLCESIIRGQEQRLGTSRVHPVSREEREQEKEGGSSIGRRQPRQQANRPAYTRRAGLASTGGGPRGTVCQAGCAHGRGAAGVLVSLSGQRGIVSGPARGAAGGRRELQSARARGCPWVRRAGGWMGNLTRGRWGKCGRKGVDVAEVKERDVEGPQQRLVLLGTCVQVLMEAVTPSTVDLLGRRSSQGQSGPAGPP